MTLMDILSATGLAFSAGQRAALVALLIGLASLTPYFELGETFAWLASPPVLVVLGVLALAELIVDAVPELAELHDEVAALPRVIVGFIGAAGAIGSVDSSLIALVGSGLLGSTAAYVAHRKVKAVRLAASEIDDGAVKAAGAATAVSATALTGSAVFAPILVVPVIIGSLVAIALLVMVYRRIRAAVAETSGMDVDVEEPQPSA